MPTNQPVAAGPVERPGSRAARLRLPRTVDILKDLAAEHGVCARPVSLRRTDLETGTTELVDLPCGATREDKCKPCATRARRLRQQQIREGWHRAEEPLPVPERPTDEQQGLVVLRAHLEFERAQIMLRPSDPDTRAAELADIDAAIAELDEEITATGLRGQAEPSHRAPDESAGDRRVRSTRRRQDAPDLPRRPVQSRTIGQQYQAPDGKTYRPSLFLTLTLPSYGRVLGDGTPADPNSYDYRAAAWDAVHFPRLLDRFWQNLRRAVGWNVQYAGSVEPQRRLAPHAHFAIRGTISRALLRQVAAATYHQVWWPPVDELRYRPDHPPVWDEPTGGYVDPDTGRPLQTWGEALDQVDNDPDAQPVHVARFGVQVHAQGVTAGSADSDRCVRYITKYLTKQAADCHQATTDRQRAHLERFHAQLRVTPCSPRCSNWLLYGIQPDRAHAKLAPGRCRGRVHQRATLGLGGRRVLVSRQWSGKTLKDHRADNRAWVRALLGLSTDDQADDTGGGTRATRYAWELARPGDPDLPPIGQRLLRAVSERIQQRVQLDQARRQANAPPEGLTPNGSLTESQEG
ncbi:replication initiation protein [Natronosporangium hydrolyticum]|uniref:Replication initiation protein n=1 Tax=Natronosporangium hydrolyticum TaxID=2811111 RepID=A0A895YHN8_9ACTN|nr:replication initiator [Natronosporangium hydrolyticum]QSB17061.1 replication initiation protein [Natronosporangium hydrolyticum]